MNSQQIINLGELNAFHRSWTIQWHESILCTQNRQPWQAIEINHFNNFSLWHEEDIARRDDIPLERIRLAKRNIDKFNQARNDAMEQIDGYVLKVFKFTDENGRGQLHSETVGMMVDRLSIMALKEYHTQEQVERKGVSEDHRQKCSLRVAILQEQQKDLSTALSLLLEDLVAGRRHIKIYRQLKMYNDPNLNPQLYGASNAR